MDVIVIFRFKTDHYDFVLNKQNIEILMTLMKYNNEICLKLP